MNQRIKISKAVSCVIIGIAVFAFLLIWPAKLIKETHISKSDEVVAMESEAVNVEHNVTQMFVAEGTTLGAVDLYVCNEMQSETITFRLYDASYTQLFNVFYQVKDNQKLPGFVHIPVDYELIPDQEYYFTLEGLSTDLYVNYEDTYASDSVVNGIMAYAGEEVPGYNVIVRYEYTNTFTLIQIILSAVILAAATALLIFLTGLMFKKFGKDKEVRVQKVFQVIFNPLIAVGTILMLLLVFPGRKFGTGAVNYGFYGISILMLAGFLLVLVNRKRTGEGPVLDVTVLKGRLGDYLQAVCFAGVLWSCFEYMNGLYDIHHAYACARLLTWFLLAIISTYEKKEILTLWNLLWLVCGGVLCWFYAKPYFGVEEQGELYKLQAYAIYAGGFVLLHMLVKLIQLIRKKERIKLPNPVFTIPYVILLAALVIMNNTRQWPGFIAVLLLLFALRMSLWKKADHLLNNLSNGIILNFLMMVLFCLWHRPFHYYIYYRYNMTYHTVTMTAVHVTLAMAAVFVKLFVKYQKTRKISEVLPWMLLFGMTGSYLLFTLSRTGFVAAGFMIFVMLIVLTVFLDKKKYRLKGFGKRVGILLLACLYAFPITFTATRIVPSLVMDPVIYEIEPREISIVKGTPSDSELYIDISRFISVFGSKVLGVGEDVTGRVMIPDTIEESPVENSLLASAETGNIFALTEDEWYVSSVDGQAMEEEEEQTDASNGRLDIFREYIKAWNLTGHEDMGVPLSDGTIAVHAHNIYLQVIHDHGLIVGIYFILFMCFAVVYSVYNLYKKKNRDLYQALIPTVLLGFMTAGLVEWIFHPCNPMGMCTFLVMLPLMFNKKGKENETEKAV